jgi:CPA2 family monovalent cation:H+ antiporter-2
MIEQTLTLVLILLAATVFVVTVTRRLGWPPILGYLIVGMVLGPHALGIIAETSTVSLLAELGVVFLLFTLGLEFSPPRMIAMRREVFGLATVQILAVVTVFALLALALGAPWPMAIVIGGAVAMSSTALILQPLTERAELNRTHGRLAFAMTLVQDLWFVPFVALASALPRGTEAFSVQVSGAAMAGAALAVGVVLVAGRWLLRPLLHEIAHSRMRELFTLAVLFVVIGAAWISHTAGLSLALGAFLAGVMLAETEYRHQIEAVIRPFRDILLGLFFISVGMLLDAGLLVDNLVIVLAMLLTMIVLKTVLSMLVTRMFVDSTFKALRASIVISIGGEFGIALLTVASPSRMFVHELVQPLLVAIVLSMVLSPLIVGNNKRIARFVLRQKGPPQPTAIEREAAATKAIAQRPHVLLCGFGRVGQNVARVLEQQGHEYIALDLDPARIREARQAGDPVLYGDSADEEMLENAGLANASAVVISFSNPGMALGIVRSVRRVRPDVPVLVRTADDARISELKEAGATEVVPETFEASLMLVSHVLMLLQMAPQRVLDVLQDIRSNRYEVLRTLIRREAPRPTEDTPASREELKSIVIPPGAWSVGRTLAQVREKGAEVTFTGIRRHGILGREPVDDTEIHEGDIVVVYGLPEALEHAESVLLAG